MSPHHPPRSPGPRRAAVVGAGVSGLAAARVLTAHGHRVTVFEKARGPGGRTSTRRDGELRFDHGAQYFTVRDPRFRRAVAEWRGRGVVTAWEGRIVRLDGGRALAAGEEETRWVGVPAMSAVARHLGDGLDLRLGLRVARLARAGRTWQLLLEDGSEAGVFGAVVVSAPAPQTADLLATAAPGLSRAAGRVRMSPCWAVMAAFDRALPLPFDGAFVAGSELGWIARDSSKPGRPDLECWVLHAGPEWSAAHLELEPPAVIEALLGAFRRATGLAEAAPRTAAAHRWRFALPPRAQRRPCLVDLGLGVAACGDWCGGPRVEGAYLSGLAAAESLIGSAISA